MSMDVKAWIAGCLGCKISKTVLPLAHGKLIPIISLRPFELLCIDIMGPLKETKERFKYILVIKDH